MLSHGQSILFAIALTCPTDIDRTVSLQRDVPTCNGARWCGALMVSNQTENPLAWNWNKLYVPCESLAVTSLSPACCSCCPSFYSTDAASTCTTASDCTDGAAAFPICTPAAVSFWASVSAQYVPLLLMLLHVHLLTRRLATAAAATLLLLLLPLLIVMLLRPWPLLPFLRSCISSRPLNQFTHVQSLCPIGDPHPLPFLSVHSYADVRLRRRVVWWSQSHRDDDAVQRNSPQRNQRHQRHSAPALSWPR